MSAPVAGSPIVAANSARRNSVTMNPRRSNSLIFTPQPPPTNTNNSNNNNNNLRPSETTFFLPDLTATAVMNLGDADASLNDEGNNNMFSSPTSTGIDEGSNNNNSLLVAANNAQMQQMIAKDLSRYSEEDIAQIKELYQTLVETGALRTDATGNEYRDNGGLPNAFQLLGSEIPGKKSGALKALIRKHKLGGGERLKQSAASFQALITMLCVPIREKRQLQRDMNKHSSGGADDFLRRKSVNFSHHQQHDDDRRRTSASGHLPMISTADLDDENNNNNDASNKNSNNNHNDQQSLSLRKGSTGIDGDGTAETPSRTSSPDLFGDLRSPSSPSTPQPTSKNRNANDAEYEAEPSPERILEKLDNISSSQTDRSKRAKRIINLSRRDLYAACEIQPVAAFNAGYDQGKLKKRSNAQHPLLVDEEARAETARYMRQMAKPRGVQPSPFHGAAARFIGDIANAASSPRNQNNNHNQQKQNSSPSTARSATNNNNNSHHSARPPLSPRTPNHHHQTKHVGFQKHQKVSSSSATKSHSRPHSARTNEDSSFANSDGGDTTTHDDSEKEDNNNNNNSQSKLDDENNNSYLSVNDDDDDDDSDHQHHDDDDDDVHNNKKKHHHHHYPSVKNQTAGGRKSVRSGGLHALIDEPENYKKKHGVVKNLSAKVKLKEAEREMNAEKIERGGYATPRTLARRLRKIEAGESVIMFDDVESKILQRWLRD